MNGIVIQAFRFFVILFFVLASACAGYGSSSSADAQLEFGVDMARQGLWSEALFRFHQADELDPRNPRILNNLAVAYEATGKFEDALAVYRRALEIAPGDRELRRNFTRFIEFYQAYKPEGEGGDQGGGEGAATEGSEEGPGAG